MTTPLNKGKLSYHDVVVFFQKYRFLVCGVISGKIR
tara:strand:- start:106 stop:213 length:108 start_codon:yes stop_codon:yes gene_type:complete